MDFRIADTFTDSLARLTGDEQKLVKTVAFDLQLNPATPGMSLHKLDSTKDKNFWSVRASDDIRLIVHRTQGSLLLCYVDHHDKAYDWAARRRLQTHPKTGAAQLVELRESVQDIFVPKYVEAPQKSAPMPLLFAGMRDDELLSYGVPLEWLADVRRVDENSLLDLAGHLPAEAAEALLQLATGGRPRVAEPVEVGADPFAHPDAQRRFRTIDDVDELRRALESPWEKWAVFLHPAQRQLVERQYNGPARVSGSAGTGKTIVALHRAVHLTRVNPDARVLLTTFSDILANALRAKLGLLVGSQPRLSERLEAHSIDAVGARLYRFHFGPVSLASRQVIGELLREATASDGGHRLGPLFLLAEWEQVVDAYQLETWESYRDVARLGRRTRLPEPQRALLWAIFERVRAGLATRGLVTVSGMLTQLSRSLERSQRSPFDYVVVDEAQDIDVAHLRLLAALGGQRHDALFFAGDLGQRIFQPPFSWLALGVDVRGRSRTLKVNYRTSHQIRAQADRLLGPEVADADGNREDRRHTVSVFNGPAPEIAVLDTEAQEIARVAEWVAQRAREGIRAHEFGVFVRSAAQLERASAALEQARTPFRILDERLDVPGGHASVGTMHLAKGLEFRAVVVMACDDEVIPLQRRVETVGDNADLQEVYDTERQLLYVACTRARDRLLVTGVAPASEFLDDLGF